MQVMARLVMKFGGTSVADIDRIRNVAHHVKREVDAGHEVAVVVSAMSGKTNQLVAWCRAASPLHDAREYDAVVASGEQVTAGLLAITLEGIGINARSWQGWQLPILTSNAHGSARIQDINGAELIKRFKERKEVAVIAGFQGIHKDTGRITTLGRGGSDTSAVAIAAAIQADRCDIYTDVDGVYTTDPRMVPRARRMDKIAFEEMLEFASLGAKVLQVRSVELGMLHKVKIFVRSSFDKPEDIDPHGTPPGTLICDEEDIVEQQTVTGIAFSKDEAQISVRHVPDKPGVAAAIFGPLAEASINVDMIVQNVSADGATTDLTFTVPAADYQRSVDVLNKSKGAIGFDHHRRLDRRRQGVGDRHRHAQPRRRRRRRLQGAGRPRRQHPRHHHVGDQVLDADRRRLHRACGAHAAYAVWVGQVRHGLASFLRPSLRPRGARAGIHNPVLQHDTLRRYGFRVRSPPAAPREWDAVDVACRAQQQISYAQRYEDMHLLRAFGEQAERLLHRHRRRPSGLRQCVVRVLSARLARHHGRAQSLARAIERGGAAARHPHCIAGRRRSPARRPTIWSRIFTASRPRSKATPARRRANTARRSQAMTMPVTTLRALCEQHAPATIDFLKIDVEGAEREVLLGGDWQRFRPKVVVLEALAPVTMAPAWEAWEPLLTAQRLSLRIFRQPQPLLRRRGARRAGRAARGGAGIACDGVTPFRPVQAGARTTPSHPDHGLARLLAGIDMVRLPLMSDDAIAGSTHQRP